MAAVLAAAALAVATAWGSPAAAQVSDRPAAASSEAAPGCGLAPPSPYGQPDTRMREVTGDIDVARVVDAANLLKNDAMADVGDIQARVERLSCEESRLAAGLDEHVARSGWRLAVRSALEDPCERGAPDPSYVPDVRVAPAGVYYGYDAAWATLTNAAVAVNRYLDDIQTRLTQIGCRQSAIKRSLVQLASASRRGPSETMTPLPPGSREDAPPHRLAARPAQDAEPPRQEVCTDIGPAPSIAAPPKRWTAPPGAGPTNERGSSGNPVYDDPVYDAETMNQVEARRSELATALDDIQVRIEQVDCEQRNINAWLTALAGR